MRGSWSGVLASSVAGSMPEADSSCLLALSGPSEDAGHALRRASGGARYELQAAEMLRSSFLWALCMLEGGLRAGAGPAARATQIRWRRMRGESQVAAVIEKQSASRQEAANFTGCALVFWKSVHVARKALRRPHQSLAAPIFCAGRVRVPGLSKVPRLRKAKGVRA